MARTIIGQIDPTEDTVGISPIKLARNLRADIAHLLKTSFDAYRVDYTRSGPLKLDPVISITEEYEWQQGGVARLLTIYSTHRDESTRAGESLAVRVDLMGLPEFWEEKSPLVEQIEEHFEKYNILVYSDGITNAEGAKSIKHRMPDGSYDLSG